MNKETIKLIGKLELYNELLNEGGHVTLRMLRSRRDKLCVYLAEELQVIFKH